MSNLNGLIEPGSLLALNQSETFSNLKIEPDSLVIKVGTAEQGEQWEG